MPKTPNRSSNFSSMLLAPDQPVVSVSQADASEQAIMAAIQARLPVVIDITPDKQAIDAVRNDFVSRDHARQEKRSERLRIGELRFDLLTYSIDQSVNLAGPNQLPPSDWLEPDCELFKAERYQLRFEMLAPSLFSAWEPSYIKNNGGGWNGYARSQDRDCFIMAVYDDASEQLCRYFFCAFPGQITARIAKFEDALEKTVDEASFHQASTLLMTDFLRSFDTSFSRSSSSEGGEFEELLLRFEAQKNETSKVVNIGN